MRNFLCFTLLCLGLPLVSQASTLQVSFGGTYSSSAPTTTYSTPGGTFTYTFFVDFNPSTFNTYTGNFSTVPTGVTYRLNGNTIATTVQLAFFRPYNLTFCLAPTCPSTPDNYISVDTASRSHTPFYTGVETSPTIMTGTFASMDGYSSYGVLAAVSNVTITAIGTTPEPSSLLLLSTGLVGAFGVVRRGHL